MTALQDPTPRVLVDCGVYADGERIPGEFTPAGARAKVREIEAGGQEAFVWVGLHEPGEAQMQGVAATFQLHPLSVEDAVQAHQRPKLERYDDTLFLALKTVNYVPHESAVLPREIVETGEIMIFVGKNFVVTVRHGEHSGLAQVRKRMDTDPEQMRLGPFAVMHAIADYVVDRYVEVTNLMESDIDVIEETAFAPGTRTDVEPIYQIKREVVELRRAVAPLSVPFERMQTDYRDLISKEVRRYLRDVADHQTRAAEQIAGYDELLSSLVQAALARVGMQQNTDMRKMSAWAGIIAVPTMIAGIYGMNFDRMPVLHWAFGYPMVVAGMCVISAVLYRAFRRNGWL
ncbi:magnesium/cobalt transporter CorA [Mycolicibacter heraklionensis]|uniref:Magnesium transport protein CorA n=1 Tax=Mycolicibacter heraklionensis TaxID=512402 RepID=A0AA91ER16_9MYCO|nr:magnesium and cobalt transport protein CorA [Mycolicibacter heraklionensis]OBJ28716.1 magnesium and cobalt transport protein CorA [Mycolicibacter heraklionensis]OBK80820.1 magnesium and cobalt transport protein CorA [Mycolicibacter heraklionensis]